MSDIDKPSSPTESSSDVNLTLRMIMNGKEVGSIIGKGGEIINNIREESGAKVHITDGSLPERIVTVTGTTEAILKVFNRICKKFEEDGGNSHKDSDQRGSGDRGERGSSSSTSRDHHRSSSSSLSSGSQVVLRLVVPASQCGSIIGKGGAKIKDIREVTGASIQVASEMLPNSTERAVTLTGNKDSLNQCIYQICSIMLESPAKVTPIPYSPKAGALGSGLMGGGHGHGRNRHDGRHGGMSSHHVDNPLASLLSLGSGASTLAALASLAGASASAGGSGHHHHHHHSSSRSSRSHHDDHRDNDGGRGSSSSSSSQTYEMSIPNDMIGCIIGKGGSKIGEIRQLSGALIRISKGEEDAGDEAERQITISGNADSVALAKSLINMSLDLHKNRLEERESSGGGGGSSGTTSSGRDRNDRRSGHSGSGSSHGHGHGHGHNNSGASSADVNLGLASLLAKPEALNALTTLASLNGLGGLGASGLLSSYGALGGQVGSMYRPRGGYGGNRSGSREDDRGSRNSKRFKFEPY